MFEAVNLFYFWLVLAIFFLFTEIATPGLFVFVAFAVGSVAAAVAAFFGYSLFVQCWSLFIAAVLGFVVFRYFFSIKSVSKIKTNVNAIVGKKGIVISDFEKNKVGRVKVGGETWSAIVESDVIFKRNDVVKVVCIQGNKLVVKKG